MFTTNIDQYISLKGYKNITELAAKNNITRGVLYKLSDNKPKTRMNIIFSLCNILDCKMSNIIEYIPDNYKKKSDSIDIAKIDRYNKYVYGVNLRLDPIMKLRGFRRKTTFLKETDISMSRQTLYEILGKQNIDSKLLRGFILLCEKLNCKLSDIIDYTPTPKRDLPEITLSKIRS